MPLVFDIEANGISPDLVTTVHCIVICDLKTGVYTQYADHEGYKPLKSGIELLSSSECIIGHNILKYDIPVLLKFFPELRIQGYFDTLVLAQMFNPDIGKHSLEAYGERFKISKISHEEWGVFSKDMMARCQRDVEINTRLFKEFESKISKTNPLPVYIEQEFCKIIGKQEQVGFKFNSALANNSLIDLENMLQVLDKTINERLPVYCKPGKTYLNPFKKDGSVCERVKNLNLPDICGGFCTVSFNKPDLTSSKQLKSTLLVLGWKPIEWNYKDDPANPRNKIKLSPKLTEESYESLPEGLGKDIADRLQCQHRINLIKGLLKRVRVDGRIPAQGKTCATPTARMTHQGVVNIPKADPKVFFGRQCRELFTCDPDRVLVGVDAKALEARCLAHYINDPIFTDMLLSSDIHNVMATLTGLSRNQAKSVTYAIIYRAGDTKLGGVVNGGIDEGKELRRKIYDMCPNLEPLINKLEKEASLLGKIKTIDGRYIITRSAYQSLNSLLQSTGSIVMKLACILANQDILKNNLDAKQVGHFHDEFIIDCNPLDSKAVSEICLDSIKRAGQILKFNIPLEGDAKIGRTWAEVH